MNTVLGSIGYRHGSLAHRRVDWLWQDHAEYRRGYRAGRLIRCLYYSFCIAGFAFTAGVAIYLAL